MDGLNMEIAFVILAVLFAVQTVRAWHWRREAKLVTQNAADIVHSLLFEPWIVVQVTKDGKTIERKLEGEDFHWPDTIES